MQTRNKFYEEVKSLLQIIFIVFLIRILLFEPFYIPSGSMNPNLLEGDYLFATKYDYGYSKFSIPFSPDIFSGRLFAKKPKAGDIVIFRPPNMMNVRYVKRLIGLPGDKIQMINGMLYINNSKVDTQYLGKRVIKEGKQSQEYNEYRQTLPNGTSYCILQEPYLFHATSQVFEVPQGHYFFLGDNRDHSADSRFDLGYVPAENLIAKAKIIYFSTSRDLLPNFDFQISDLLVLPKRLLPWISSIRFSRVFHIV